MIDAQLSLSHMAQATLIRRDLAHYVVTSNLDGIYRKAGLKGHTQLCCLHGDVYIERCTVDMILREIMRFITKCTCAKCGPKPLPIIQEILEERKCITQSGEEQW